MAKNTPLKQKRFAECVGRTISAFGLMEKMAENGWNHDQAHSLLRYLQQATSAAQSLERMMAGTPQPKTGEAP